MKNQNNSIAILKSFIRKFLQKEIKVKKLSQTADIVWDQKFRIKA